MYVTPDQLADRPGATELAAVATPAREAIVDAALMEATLRNADRSTWPADEVAVADAALERITEAVNDAGGVIDGYLARRMSVPLDPVPSIVRVWATAIVRYLLHKDRQSTEGDDPIVRDYKDALKFLQLTADGKFSLGATDTDATTGGEPAWDAPGRVFTRDTLADYGSGL